MLFFLIFNNFSNKTFEMSVCWIIKIHPFIGLRIFIADVCDQKVISDDRFKRKLNVVPGVFYFTEKRNSYF